MADRPAAVIITGLGVVSPLGVSVAELANRVCAGESAVGPLTDVGVGGAFGARVKVMPLEVLATETRLRSGRLDRLCQLFLSATYLAVEAAGLDVSAADAERCALSFGTGFGCLLTDAQYNHRVIEHGPGAASPRLFAYTVSSAAAGEVSIALGVKGANVTAHMGVAAGLGAIGYGCDLIRRGKAEVVLAGGADALGEALVRGLADMGLLKSAHTPSPATARPFRDVAAGVCPAEAAVVVVLERDDRARNRGARSWARIAGYAAGFEPTLTGRERECTGIATTLRRALATSGQEPAAIDLVMTSAHATAVDETERAALECVFGQAPSPLLFAGKSAWGECFAADGALSLALATALLQQPPPPLADGIALELHGGTVRAARNGSARVQRARLAIVHSLCYSGPTVALVLARQE